MDDIDESNQHNYSSHDIMTRKTSASHGSFFGQARGEMTLMKIFFSHHHNANAPLVERIKADLESRGHVWFDADHIKSGFHKA